MSSDSPVGEGLGARLKAICQAAQDVPVVWDIGCDHGHVGLALGGAGAREVHLVDPAIGVQQKWLELKDADIPRSFKVFYHPKKGEELHVPRNSDSCFVMAGMGGKKIAAILTHLVPQISEGCRFVISPHRDLPLVRAQMRELGLGLVCEQLVREGGRFYEVLVAHVGPGREVSPYGEAVWDGDDGEAYRQHCLAGLAKHRDATSEGLRRFLTQRVQVLPIR